MSGYKYIEIGTILFLGWVVIWLTLPFEQHYDESIRVYSHEPIFRIMLGFLLLIVSTYSISVALLLFLIIFFWIADIHLVSSMKFDDIKID
jgi:hypothetical protein